MKKVLGLVVSERNLGNSEILVKEIMDAVPDPCERELIRLTDLKIEPCKACYRCLSPGSRCMKKDDFNFVLDRILEADGLIIGLPVYFLGPHGSYKMLTDRFLGAGHYSRHTRGKPCAVVIPFGLPGWEGYTRTAALVLPRLLEMRLVDCWQVHATLPGESMLKDENREYARRLGSGLFTAREFDRGIRECPHCGSDLFRLLPGGEIECPLCAARGNLRDGGVPDFSWTGSTRFSAERLEEHFNVWLVEMKDKYLRERDILKEIQKPYRGKQWWVKKKGGENGGTVS